MNSPGHPSSGASKDILDWRNGWDEDELIKFGATNNLEWTFIMAESQHQNGVMESMVKQVKAVQKSLIQVFKSLFCLFIKVF